MGYSQELEITRTQILRDIDFQTRGGLNKRPLSSLKAPEDLILNPRIRFPRGVDNMVNNKSLGMSRCIIPDNKVFLENSLRKARSFPSVGCEITESAAGGSDRKKGLQERQQEQQGQQEQQEQQQSPQHTTKSDCRCSRCGRTVVSRPDSSSSFPKLEQLTGADKRAGGAMASPLTTFLTRLSQRESEAVLGSEAQQVAARRVAEAAVRMVPYPYGVAPKSVLAPPGSGGSGSRVGSGISSQSLGGFEGGCSGGGRRVHAVQGAKSKSTTSISGLSSSSGWPTTARSPKRVVVPQMMEWSPLLLTNGYGPRGLTRAPFRAQAWATRTF